MKKVVFIFLLLGLAACQSGEVQFKNPVFYQPLRGGGRLGGNIQLTPTSLTYLEDDESLPATCELLKDEGFRITMKCIHPPYRTTPAQTYYHRFTNIGPYVRRYISEPTEKCEVQMEMNDEPDFETPAYWAVYLVPWDAVGKECGPKAPKDQYPPFGSNG